MPPHILLPFMHVAYIVAGAVFLLAVSAVLGWLCLSPLRRSSRPRTLVGQEFIWTLVPVLILLGLTLAGEIPREWGRFAERRGVTEVWAQSK